MEDFVPFELAKKLNEKGFTCEYPFAMYTEYEQFCPLYTSDEYFFRIDDFGKHKYIAPTISQVLKWLRENKDVVVSMNPYYGKFVNVHWWWDIRTPVYKVEICNNIKQEGFDSYELAALAGIEYALDNLI